MKRFLNRPKAEANRLAWHLLLGKLEAAEERGEGIKHAQVAQLRQDVADFLEGLKAPKKTAQKPKKQTEKQADDPTKWRKATFAEALQYPVNSIQELSTATSGNLLKATLRARWPQEKFSLKTDRYGITRLIWCWSNQVSYDVLYDLVRLFEGEESAAPMDGTIAVYRWRPTVTDTRLVRHGLRYIMLAPQDSTGWDVDASGVRHPVKHHYN